MGWPTLVTNLDSAVFAALSDSLTATYTPTVGDAVTNVSIVVDQGTEEAPPGFEINTNEILYTITVRKSEVGTPLKGSTFTDGVTTWDVVDIANDDGTVLTLNVSPQ